MKKFLIKVLIAVLIFSGFSYAVYHSEEHDDCENPLHVHVQKLEAVTYETDTVCPECGARMVIDSVIYEPGCTDIGVGLGHCSQMSRPTCPGGNYDVTILPIGHDLVATVISAPTCTESGETAYECHRCYDYSYIETTSPLGHNYKKQITKESTCEEGGITTYTCTRCGDSYTKKTPALGHDIKYEEKEMTCLEDGYRKGTCSRCDKTINEFYLAPGHDIKYEVLTQATCEEEGERKATCNRCGETWMEKIPPLGHKYPSEWTIVKEATILEEGLETKKCLRCGHILEHILPKKDSTPAIIGGSVGTAVVAGGLWMFLKKRKAAKLVEKAVKKLGKPSFEDRTVVISSEDEKLRELLKSKPFLAVSSCTYEDLEKTAAEKEPDLVIIDIGTKKKLNELDKKRKAVPEKKEGEKEKTNPLAETSFAYLCPQKFIDKYKDELEAFKEEKNIVGYGLINDNPIVNLVKTVLPVLKPNLKSDAALDNIGMIADALGIPYVSTIISTYESGKDIKSTIEEGEMNVSSVATVVSDLASILGMDTVASVAGLVDDVNSVKDALDEEAGAHEVKGAHSSVKDIVDVVTDLKDKD
ncbi:MAG: hypothetical protein IJF87_10230 [Erysipelotrichaceae bacterium]|nr:hypothetical protein [Erysipelotrichaceae bacterium]